MLLGCCNIYAGRSILRYGRYYDMIQYGPVIGLSHEISIIRMKFYFMIWLKSCYLPQLSILLYGIVYFMIWDPCKISISWYEHNFQNFVNQNVFFTIWVQLNDRKYLFHNFYKTSRNCSHRWRLNTSFNAIFVTKVFKLWITYSITIWNMKIDFHIV